MTSWTMTRAFQHPGDKLMSRRIKLEHWSDQIRTLIDSRYVISKALRLSSSLCHYGCLDLPIYRYNASLMSYIEARTCT